MVLSLPLSKGSLLEYAQYPTFPYCRFELNLQRLKVTARTNSLSRPKIFPGEFFNRQLKKIY
jgi:hypothetical protein